MSLNIFPLQNNTFSRLYLRQNLIVLEEVTSTNDYLKELLSNITPLPEATAIMATHQVKGRGQRGNSWLSQPSETLAISFALYPKDFFIQQSFNLNMLICLGIQRWASTLLPNVQIKWPNDIFVNGKKLGGVLIENQLSGSHIRSSVIGIGINIKQETFPIAIQDKATSLYIENPKASAQSLEYYALSLLSTIMACYESIDLQDTQRLLDAYNECLFRKGIPAHYEIEGETCLGIIQGLESDGKLKVLINERVRLFDLKEISFKL
ncbi:biotin--[acetyl-CoA-carboxylase] ligase [Sphingobacterium sp. SGR-19]|uniref:biotin--[acetyl-CoA-carboxylase] ligase n=1 Tax=Sphingobacterium sp. SGR-19 TaxID=2710886 RepID=UPI0013ED9B85|nr:biotin--[acetyl-CoA-carboxylase] ligase [Sphingobacterium sp. SGR-19]NGM65900.1 biotin--[acetyl-CoA-carboxylase] ligase [Sphingobacterium sp. SGR-19]